MGEGGLCLPLRKTEEVGLKPPSPSPASAAYEECLIPGAHQLKPPSPLISSVNPFPSRFINGTISYCYVLESHEYTCCLPSFLHFIGFSLCQRAKPPEWTVLFINLLGKGLILRASVGDGGTIWWAPANTKCKGAAGSKLTDVLCGFICLLCGLSEL